jgi:hypothetical protein
MMPENCDPACVKNIINTRLIAYIATLLAETAGEGHPLFRPARILAAAARAACEAYAVAIEEGTLTHSRQPSGWNGCEDAEMLQRMVLEIGDGSRGGYKHETARIVALTIRANTVTANLVRMRE